MLGGRGAPSTWSPSTSALCWIDHMSWGQSSTVGALGRPLAPRTAPGGAKPVGCSSHAASIAQPLELWHGRADGGLVEPVVAEEPTDVAVGREDEEKQAAVHERVAEVAHRGVAAECHRHRMALA